jgi:RNA polymerase-associated protein RTF1
MDMSDSESEDGQITAKDAEWDTAKPKKSTDEDDAPATLHDLTKIHITRGEIAKHFYKPWFPEWIKGTFVRFSLGENPQGKTVYRICEVQGLFFQSCL